MQKEWVQTSFMQHQILIHLTLLLDTCLIINTVSVNLDLNKYLSMLTLDGAMVLVGIPENQVQFAAPVLVGARRSVAGSGIGGIKETQEMLDFCQKNNTTCDIEKISIDKVNETYKRVLNSDVKYRFVIDIANSLKCNNNNNDK